MGRLQVTICGARKLHDNQVIGIPDPYARVKMGQVHYKTRTVDNNLNPVWDETFTFQVADASSAQLVVELWNKNVISDDLMGMYSLSVGNLTRGVVVDDWHVLNRSKTNAEIHVRVLAVDFGNLPRPEEQWKVTTDINNDPQRNGGKMISANPGKAGFFPMPATGGAPPTPVIIPACGQAVHNPAQSMIGSTPMPPCSEYYPANPAPSSTFALPSTQSIPCQVYPGYTQSAPMPPPQPPIPSQVYAGYIQSAPMQPPRPPIPSQMYPGYIQSTPMQPPQPQAYPVYTPPPPQGYPAYTPPPQPQAYSGYTPPPPPPPTAMGGPGYPAAPYAPASAPVDPNYRY